MDPETRDMPPDLSDDAGDDVETKEDLFVSAIGSPDVGADSGVGASAASNLMSDGVAAESFDQPTASSTMEDLSLQVRNPHVVTIANQCSLFLFY